VFFPRKARPPARPHIRAMKPEWADDVKQLAADEGRLIVEILEDAIEAYKKKGKR